MKKLICVLLSLMLLLSFAACNKEKDASKEKSDKELVEEFLVCQVKVRYGIATEEEFRATYSEKYWAYAEETLGQAFDVMYEDSKTSGATIDGVELMDSYQMLTERFGENYKISVEIIGFDKYPYSPDETGEEMFARQCPHLSLDDIEKACNVNYKIIISGDKETYEGPEMRDTLFKIDGRWCYK